MKTLIVLATGFVVGVVIGAWADLTVPAAADRTPVSGVLAFVSETDTETDQLIRDDQTWSGIWAFTARYHALARMENRCTSMTTTALNALPRPEQVKYYEQLVLVSSTAVTYAVAGSTLPRRWVISQSPGIIRQESVGTFAAANDHLRGSATAVERQPSARAGRVPTTRVTTRARRTT